MPILFGSRWCLPEYTETKPILQVIASICAHEGAVIVDSDEVDVTGSAGAGDDAREYVRAAFDYEGGEGHLALMEGDRVRVLQKHDSGW